MQKWQELSRDMPIDQKNPLNKMAQEYKKNVLKKMKGDSIEAIKSVSQDLVVSIKYDGEYQLCYYNENGLSQTKGKGEMSPNINSVFANGTTFKWELPCLSEFERVVKEKGYKSIIVAGELLRQGPNGEVLRGPEAHAFSDAVKIDPKSVKFYIFDILEMNSMPVSGAYWERLAFLDSLFSNVNKSLVEVVHWAKGDKNVALDIWNHRIIPQNLEGMVVRTASGILKIKIRHDIDVGVIGVTEGDGKFTGMVGAINVALMDDNGILRYCCSVGGFNDSERIYLWQYAKDNFAGEGIINGEKAIFIKPGLVMPILYYETAFPEVDCFKFNGTTYERLPQLKGITFQKPQLMKDENKKMIIRKDKSFNPQDLRLSQVPDWNENKIESEEDNEETEKPVIQTTSDLKEKAERVKKNLMLKLFGEKPKPIEEKPVEITKPVEIKEVVPVTETIDKNKEFIQQPFTNEYVEGKIKDKIEFIGVVTFIKWLDNLGKYLVKIKDKNGKQVTFFQKPHYNVVQLGKVERDILEEDIGNWFKFKGKISKFGEYKNLKDTVINISEAIPILSPLDEKPEKIEEKIELEKEEKEEERKEKVESEEAETEEDDGEEEEEVIEDEDDEINLTESKNNYNIHEMSKDGNLESVKRLIPYAYQTNKDLSLIDAIKNNQKEVIDYLMENGANVRALDDYASKLAIKNKDFELFRKFTQKAKFYNNIKDKLIVFDPDNAKAIADFIDSFNFGDEPPKETIIESHEPKKRGRKKKITVIPPSIPSEPVSMPVKAPEPAPEPVKAPEPAPEPVKAPEPAPEPIKVPEVPEPVPIKVPEIVKPSESVLTPTKYEIDGRTVTYYPEITSDPFSKFKFVCNCPKWFLEGKKCEHTHLCFQLVYQ